MIKLIFSSLLGVIISAIIMMFQNENKYLSFWMAVYFFPMYFLLNALINYILLKRYLKYINTFFIKRQNFYIVFILLIILFFVSCNHYFYVITVFSFLVNFFAFIFSVLIYQQILTPLPEVFLKKGEDLN